ncbi:MAG: hypothetical protein IPM17_17510 [Verrucomicrobia bacterium]|nr:hypothetical protein [Verrucomicrobiota bacterium]
MPHRVVIERPVVEFIAHLPPDTRKLVRAALRRFAAGDWEATSEWPSFHRRLEGQLVRFGRIRAGRIRLVYADATDPHGPVKRVFYAGWRAGLYDALEQVVVSEALRELGAYNTRPRSMPPVVRFRATYSPGRSARIVSASKPTAAHQLSSRLSRS